jgi:hypothetical protein
VRKGGVSIAGEEMADLVKPHATIRLHVAAAAHIVVEPLRRRRERLDIYGIVLSPAMLQLVEAAEIGAIRFAPRECLPPLLRGRVDRPARQVLRPFGAQIRFQLGIDRLVDLRFDPSPLQNAEGFTSRFGWFGHSGSFSAARRAMVSCFRSESCVPARTDCSSLWSDCDTVSGYSGGVGSMSDNYTS